MIAARKAAVAASRRYSLAGIFSTGNSAQNRAASSESGKNRDKETLQGLKKAAEAGDVEAQFGLSGVYLQGDLGVEESAEKSLYWAEKAAEQGFHHAQYHLAIMHQLGAGGLKPSVEKARGLFELAAEQGNEEAMFQLSCTYMPDDGDEEDLDGFLDDSEVDDSIPDTPLSAAMSKVARREMKAANNDNRNSREVDQVLSAEEEVEMQRKALYWVCRAAKKGHAGAQFNLGVMHLLDKYPGVERSEAVARRLFQKSAKQGNPEAQYNLGCMFMEGVGGLKMSVGKGLKLFEMAAEQGHHEAAVALLELNEDAGEEKDSDSGGEFVVDADSIEGVHDLVNELSKQMKELGLTKDEIKQLVEVDNEDGDPWLEDTLHKLVSDDVEEFSKDDVRELILSDERVRKELVDDAEKGDAEAAFMLGCMMAEGVGGEQDYDGAARWLRMAKANGHDSAEALLEEISDLN